MMDAYDLLKNHQYADAIREYRKRLEHNSEDWEAVGGLGCALQAAGAYAEALPFLHRLDEKNRASLRGSPGRKLDLACLYWLLDQRPVAMETTRWLVQGILDGSVEFGDRAGGVEQGLLLHYMGVTARDKAAIEFSLSYLRKLARKSVIQFWPGPLARYMLREISFEDMLFAASGESTLRGAIEAARGDILKRRDTCVALFHDGVGYRTEGQEDLCMGRMRQCVALVNTLSEPEWYLARYEVERATTGVQWHEDAATRP